MNKIIQLLIAVTLMGCSGADGEPSDPGSVTSASNPVCLSANGAFYMSFEETSGTCGPITGLYFSTDKSLQITPGGNSGLSCPITTQNSCSPTGPNCIGGSDISVDSFDVVLKDPANGSGTMKITGKNCSSTYSVTVTGS